MEKQHLYKTEWADRGDRVKRKGVMSISMVLLLGYVFFLFTAQQTLIPPIVHSMVMYAFIGWNMLVFMTGVGKIRFFGHILL